jgi:hypothetical protein
MLLAARLFFPRNKKSDLIRFLNVLLYQEERNPFPKGQVKKNFFSIPSALSPGRNFLFFFQASADHTRYGNEAAAHV